MLYSELRTVFYDILGGESGISTYVSNDVADSFAMQAVRRMAQETGCLEKRNIQAVTAGTSEYSLPSDCVNIKRVSFDDEKLLPVMKSQLRAINARWRDHSGTPRYYYLDEQTDTIGLYENPSSGSTAVSMTGPVGGVIVDITGLDGGVTGPTGGVLVDIAEEPGTGPVGGAYVEVIDGNGLEIVYEAEPTGLEPIPLPAWAHSGVLYFMLWKTLSSATLLENQKQAAFWRSMYEMILDRLRLRARGKINRRWVTRRYGDEKLGPQFPVMPEHIPEPS